MNTAVLEIEQFRHAVEILTAIQIDSIRTAIKVYSSENLMPGRSGQLRHDGVEYACVIVDVTPIGRNYVIELRCIENTTKLLASAAEL